MLLGEEQEWMHKLGTYTKQDATLYGISLVERNKAKCSTVLKGKGGSTETAAAFAVMAGGGRGLGPIMPLKKERQTHL